MAQATVAARLARCQVPAGRTLVSCVGGALGAAREADGLGADRDEPIVSCGYRSRGTQDGYYDSASRDRMDAELDYDSLGDMIRRSDMVRSAVIRGESRALQLGRCAVLLLYDVQCYH
jgi:hypothetical protein